MEKKDPFVLRHLAEVQPELWWLDSDPLEPESHAALIGDVGADLCVVGAGYTGLWTALLAKERDPKREVIVLEQYQIECDWERTGELRVAVAPWQLKGMVEEARLRNEMGDRVEVLDREQVQARIHSASYEGALFDVDGTALVDPARLVWGLERACLSLGVTIHENSKVEWLDDVDDAVRVHTPYGAVTAAKVALATNVFPSLIRQARKYVVPVYDYTLVTEPLSDAQLESIGWKGREGVADSGNLFHYYRLTKDNSILWGGYDAIYTFRAKARRDYEFNAETYAKLASHFLKTFPQLAGVKFTHAWGGAIDTCTRFSPFWGTAYGRKASYVMGFTGLGVASTRFGASVMLDLLDGCLLYTS